MQHYYAGIDLGTSGCRLIIIDAQGHIQSSSSISYKETEAQSPALWWDSVCQLLNDLPLPLKANLCSLAIDGTSGTILLVDEAGHPSSSVLMYSDLRAIKEAQQIKAVLTAKNGGQGASGSLARLLWLLKYEANPEHKHAVHQADFVLGKLANDFALSDENNCLKLGYDVENYRWPDALFSQLGIKKTMLPRVFHAGTELGLITKESAQLLGLPESLKLVAGTTDSIAAFIATGASQVGEAVSSLGSTLVVKLISDKPIFSPEHGVYSHRHGDQWLVGGASNSGAKVLRHFFSQAEIDRLSKELLIDQPTVLNYYPLLEVGERFPIADVSKQPRLSPRPDSDLVFFQGILEGIASIEAQAYQKLFELGAPKVSCIYSVGGGSKNNAWTEIRKSYLKVDMIAPEQTEAAYGSALLALNRIKQEC
jgi:hypothetical protein